MDNRIYIFDTTLRDGQQCPGAGMSFEDNLKYAHLATAVGVDIIEAGFPAASNLDFEIVKEIADQIGSSDMSYDENGNWASAKIAALCQLREDQIEKTAQALSPAIRSKRARLHVYLPVDPDLMIASLGDKASDRNFLINQLSRHIKYAVSEGLEVEFSPEGYSRMRDNFDFTTDLIRAAIESGATVINLPDTIGGAFQYQGDDYIVNLINRHFNIISKEFTDTPIVWSAHCHNDFGLATINTLNAVFGGPVRQIEGCFNGIGERAGNASLEQCILLLNQFGGVSNSFWSNAKASMIQKICNFVSERMLKTQDHYPISGKNAMRHTSGGHTNAILKNPTIYQPFDPSIIGSEISLVFGPLSGGNHAKSIIEGMNYLCSDEEKVEISQYIKNLYSDRRKGITDEEVIKGYIDFRSPLRVSEIYYSKSSNRSEVSLKGSVFGRAGEYRSEHIGQDSALAALKEFIDGIIPNLSINSYFSESLGEGVSAKSLSRIVVSDNSNRLYSGEGTDQDIEIAAMKALISAVNNYYVESNYKSLNHKMS